MIGEGILFRLRRELVRREGQLSVLACRGISWRSIVVGRPPPRPPYACWTGRCPHGSEEPAKKEKGEQQTLETILLVQALVVSEAGAACAGSLWAKTGGGCVRHDPISGFGRIQRRASGRPGGKKRIGAKWVPAKGKETRGSREALHFSALGMIFLPVLTTPRSCGAEGMAPCPAVGHGQASGRPLASRGVVLKILM